MDDLNDNTSRNIRESLRPWRDVKCTNGHDLCDRGGPMAGCPYCVPAFVLEDLTNFEKVGAFMDKFDLPVEDETDPHILDDKTFLFRYDLISEETHEILKAHREGNLEKFADGIGDLLYVVYGMAHVAGIPIDKVFAEIARANITKARSTGDDDQRSTRKSSMDVVKPEGWKGPDVAGVLLQDTLMKRRHR